MKTTIAKGETINLAIDWRSVEKNIGTTVSSSAWESSTTSITLGASTLSGSIATVPVTNANSSTGCATLTNTATMADGQVMVRKLQLEIIDDSCEPLVTNDYRRYY
jgi:hypothetical protein